MVMIIYRSTEAIPCRMID